MVRLLFTCSIVFLFACAARTPLLVGQPAYAARSSQPAENESRIVTCRENVVFDGASLTMEVFLDGTKLGPLAHGGCFVVDVDPGRHLVRARLPMSDNSRATAELGLSVSGGRTAFVWAKTSFGPVTHLSRLSVAEGQATVAQSDLRKPFVTSLVRGNLPPPVSRSNSRTRQRRGRLLAYDGIDRSPAFADEVADLRDSDDAPIRVAMVPAQFSDDAAAAIPPAVFEDAFMSAFADTGAFEVIGRGDIEAILEAEKTKDLAGCDDTACFSEIGGALGVPYLLTTAVARVGAEWVVNSKLINIREATVVRRQSRLIPDRNSADVIRHIPAMVVDLLQR